MQLPHDYATEDNSTHEILSTLPSGLSRLKGHGEETFLLVSAALANLTFMSPVTSSAMRHNATVRTLVTAVRAAPRTTLFAKDQVSSTESVWVHYMQKIPLSTQTNLPSAMSQNYDINLIWPIT